MGRQEFQPIVMIPDDEKASLQEDSVARLQEVHTLWTGNFFDTSNSEKWTVLPDMQVAENIQLYKDERQHYLVGSIDIPCSLRELGQMATVNSNKGFRMLMELYHGKNFIDGAILVQDLQFDLFSSSNTAFSRSITQGLMSIKYFVLQHGAYRGKPKTFTMIDHIQLKRANSPSDEGSTKPTLVRIMQPYATTDRAVQASKYDSIPMEFGMVAHECSDKCIRVTWFSYLQTSDEVELQSYHSLASKLISDQLSETENVIITARLSRYSNSNRRVDWIEDSERQRCNVCLNAFSTFRRRHHCRVCGEVVCRQCSSLRQAHLNGVGLTELRVCESCCNRRLEKPSKSPKEEGVSNTPTLPPASVAHEVHEKNLNERTSIVPIPRPSTRESCMESTDAAIKKLLREGEDGSSEEEDDEIEVPEENVSFTIRPSTVEETKAEKPLSPLKRDSADEKILRRFIRTEPKQPTEVNIEIPEEALTKAEEPIEVVEESTPIDPESTDSIIKKLIAEEVDDQVLSLELPILRDDVSKSCVKMQCSIASQALDAKAACMVIVAKGKAHFEVTLGLEEGVLPRIDSLYDVVTDIGLDKALLIRDCSQDPRTQASVFVRKHRIKFFAGVNIPVTTPSGSPIGCVYVCDEEARDINPSLDTPLLLKIARIVAEQIRKQHLRSLQDADY